MQLPRTLLLALGLLSTSVQAVFKDEVGDVDYHHELLGVPQRQATLFHRPRRDDKASLLYTLSDLGVLGAVNPSNGAVVWRHMLTASTTEPNDQGHAHAGKGHLRAPQDDTWVATALGSSVQVWDALTGRSLWSLDFDGEVRDLELVEADVGHDLVTLHREQDGTTVARRVVGATGAVAWEFRERRDVPLQVSTSLDRVFVVSLHGALLSYSVAVTTLNAQTGARLDQAAIGTKGDVRGEADVMLVGANSAAPFVAWTDHARSVLRLNVLGTPKRLELALEPDTRDVEVLAPSAPHAAPHFLVHCRTATGHAAHVYTVDLKTNAVTLVYSLPHEDGPAAFAVSSNHANVYFTRITAHHVTLTASTSHALLASWPRTDTTHDEPLYAVADVLKKTDSDYAVRAALVDDSDDWSLVRNGDLAWVRREGLSSVVAATWADRAESEDLARTLAAEAHSSPLQAYVHRLNRHLHDLVHLPAFLQALPQRLVSSVTGSGSTSGSSFGLNKLIVLATSRGKLYGLDAGDHGRIVWSKKASETPVASIPWDVRAIHADDAKGFVTVRGAAGEFIIVRADTGATVEAIPTGLFPAIDSAVPVDSEAGPWLLPINAGGQLTEVPLSWAPKQTIVTRTPEGGLQGLRFQAQPKGDKAVAVPAWSFATPKGQSIVHVATRPAHDPVASIGRVLGDRSVKYKYLNPNTAVVAAANADAATLTIYLLDTVSGQILNSAIHEGVDAAQGVNCALAENWFACSFYAQQPVRDSAAASSGSAAPTLRGYQLSVSDLYESDLSNDRGPLGDAESFSSLDPVNDPTVDGPALVPSVVSKTYVVPYPLSALAVTQTRQGISTRHLLAYSADVESVVGLPRSFLDPRRPVGRDPTAQELEEGLSRYQPALDPDPRNAPSHERRILLQSSSPSSASPRILVGPALLESTCLVLAYGPGAPDLFGARVTPSGAFDVLGRGFNKPTVVATVIALFVGLTFLGPMVRKKQIDGRWKAPT